MREEAFALRPFAAKSAPAIDIRGVVRREHFLYVCFSLAGDLASIDLPTAVPAPGRRHELWRQTCFEVFLGPQQGSVYWEINRSPAGWWNVYRFDAYRRGMREESLIEGLAMVSEPSGAKPQWALRLDLRPLGLDGSALTVGICAVIRAADGSLSHWALLHPSPRPDFHERRGHCLAL